MKNAWMVRSPLLAGVISLDEFRMFSYQDRIPERDDTILICILNPDSDYHDNMYVQGFKDVLQIKFWDVIGPTQGATLDGITKFEFEPITDEQGMEIAKFIIKNKGTASKFLVHCSAGISRSAGVAKAIECISLFYDSDNMKYDYATGCSSAVDRHSRYSPNHKVFDCIVEAAQKLQQANQAEQA